MSMANCAPPWRGRPSATTTSRRPSRFSWFARSMSRTKTFVRTRAPASRQTRAATDSNAHPRRPNTPAVAHAARWWPWASRGRPHRQLRTLRGRGKRRRRERRMRKGCESNLETCLWEARSKEHLPLVLVATRAWLVRDRAIQATRPLTETVSRGKSRLASAIQCVAGKGHHPLKFPLDAGPPRDRPMMEHRSQLSPKHQHTSTMIGWRNNSRDSQENGQSCQPRLGVSV